MTTGFAIQTAFEIGFALLLVIGLIFEDKVADFEQAVFRAVKLAIRRRRSKNANIRHAQVINLSRRNTGA